MSLLASIEVLLIIFMRNISILPTAPFHILALLLYPLVEYLTVINGMHSILLKLVNNTCTKNPLKTTVYLFKPKIVCQFRMISLKWESHEILYFHFFSLYIEPIWAPDKQAKMVWLINSFPRRYSNSKFKHSLKCQHKMLG